MPHINSNTDLPGIRGLFDFRPESARPMSELAQVLLREHGSSLSSADREFIAAFVSFKNECQFCHRSHRGAALAWHKKESEGGAKLMEQILNDFESAPVSSKLKALLNIASKVQISGRNVKEADIERARSAGASELEIHDAVLIAAAFCMFNRYVDGLAAVTPDDEGAYEQMGEMLVEQGYVR